MQSTSESGNPRTPDEDPLVTVDRWRLYKEIEKRTIWTCEEFEQLVGWSFSMGDAPASKKQLAWDLMNLPRSQQQILQEVRLNFPGSWMSFVK